jgi:hypothetical protein
MDHDIRRSRCITGQRSLANLLERRPDLELPYSGSDSYIEIIPLISDQRQQLAKWAEVLTNKKADIVDGQFALAGELDGLRIRVLCYAATVEGVEWQQPARVWLADGPPQPGDIWADARGKTWCALGGSDDRIAMVSTSDWRGTWWDADEVMASFGPMTLRYRGRDSSVEDDDDTGGAE